MDFFKTCKTNVQICNDISTIHCSVYESNDKSKESGDIFHTIITRLRNEGVLCTSVKDQIWIFRNNDNAASVLSCDGDHEFKLLERERLDAEREVEPADDREVDDVLMESIEAAVSFQLAKISNVIRIGPSTWILPSWDTPDGGDEGLSLRLNLRYSEDGSLYATTTTRPTHFKAMRNCDLEKAKDIVLAPNGIPARYLPPDDSVYRGCIAGEYWQSRVIKSLAAEGIKLPEGTKWMPICLDTSARRPEFVTWPMSLCFASLRFTTNSCRHVIDREEWRFWFAPSHDAAAFKSSLTFAEEWFVGAEDRHHAAIQELPHISDGANSINDLSMTGSDPMVTSPSFVQRTADQQAVMSGIYPTPEDNLFVPQVQPQMSDVGTNAAHDPSNTISELTSGGDEHNLRGHTSSSDPPAFHPQSDDLFGEMSGEMDFGGGEVGDADFDFFNEEEAASIPDDGDVGMLEPEQVAASEEDPVHGHDATSGKHFDDNDSIEPPAGENRDLTAPQGLGIPFALEHGLINRTTDDTTMQILDEEVKQPPQKPLSPFGIKERLLPPPVPASAKFGIDESADKIKRRSSTFDPVRFKDGLDIGGKYSAAFGPSANYRSSQGTPQPEVDISLPPRNKKPRIRRASDEDPDASNDDSESEEDSYESDSSVSDDDMPPKLPWDTKKRKRSDLNSNMAASEFQTIWRQADAEEKSVGLNEEEMDALLEQLLSLVAAEDPALTVRDASIHEIAEEDATITNLAVEKLASVEDLHDLKKVDLVYIAQLISEQAVSCLGSILESLDLTCEQHPKVCPTVLALQSFVEQLCGQFLPEIINCDISRLALIREPNMRAQPTLGSARPGQPRPPQRSESVIAGPDLTIVPPPFVQVQRGNDSYEMLPPALEFWETLSLAPSNGTKHVRAFCVYPFNDDLSRLVDGFMNELGAAYEHCKLGLFTHSRSVSENHGLNDYQDGLAPVELADDNGCSIEAALRAYSATCAELGTFLSSIGHLESERDRTFVICLVNPFPHEPRAMQHLCASFWKLYEAYRDNVPKAYRNHTRSDIVLQMIPVQLVASADTLVCLNSGQLGAIAKEVYDRCPPSSAREDMSSVLPIYAAPYVELATPPPKRIAFQLSAEAPSDLLYEASPLHVAYATSEDGQWINVAWTDATGHYQSSVSLCMRGKSFAAVAEDIWQRTRAIMAARDVSWRIFLITPQEIEDATRRCWRKVIEWPRKHPYSVTLLSANLQPDLKLTLPAAAEGINAASGAGILTPAGTPHATGSTASPDTIGQNVPPTPAPSEPPTAFTPDNEPDAHLLDLTDDTLVVLFSRSYSSVTTSGEIASLANGALIKRGEAGLGTEISGLQLPCLALSLLWTVQVRPNGVVDEGNVKHGEMTLKDVLRMYRNLTVLTRAKGLHIGESGCAVLPVHLVSALKGANSLNGYLS